MGLDESSFMRGDIWKFICKTEKQRQAFHNDLYQKFLKESCPIFDSKIEKDIHRTAPDSKVFSEPAESGNNKLYNILKAYSQYD